MGNNPEVRSEEILRTIFGGLGASAKLSLKCLGNEQQEQKTNGQILRLSFFLQVSRVNYQILGSEKPFIVEKFSALKAFCQINK